MNCVLGINPASNGNKGGFGLVTVEHHPMLIDWGDYKIGQHHFDCATDLFTDTLTSRLRDPSFDILDVAIENQYAGVNHDSTIKLARGAGRMEEAAAYFGLDVTWVYPKSWQSKELSGCRKRDELKKASCLKVKLEYGITTQHFAADAILIARYHAIELAMEAR